MDGKDVSDGLVVGQHLLEFGEIGRRVFRCFERGRGTAGDLGNLQGPLAVGAVDQDQQLAGLGHETGDHRLDGEGA